MANKLNFNVLMLLLMVSFIGMISYVFNISGWKFYTELIIVFGLMFITLFGLLLVFNKVSFGYALTGFAAAIILINLILFYFKMNLSTLLFLAIISAITSFVVSVVNVGEEEERQMPPLMEEEKEIEVPVVKTYVPGKVVSSKSSNVYHVPTCDWAKKIKKSNRVFFDSEEVAKKEGLKAHSCAK